jgi:uncharacterized integral membrane protein
MRLRMILLSPLLVLLALFAVSNTAVVPIGLWPTGWLVDAPVSAAILVGMAGAFVVGGLVVWVGRVGERRRLRRAEARVAALQAELDRVRGGAAPPKA